MTDIRLLIKYKEVSSGKVIELSREDKKYLFNVLRLSSGDIVFVLDGNGKEFKSRIIDKDHLEIIKEVEPVEEDSFNLVLCQSLLKGEKMDFVIQKSTELGVKKIIPFVSERCIIKSTNKIERWRRISKEASEQSGRTTVPEIDSPINFDNLINSIENGIIFWEKAEKSLINALLKLNLKETIFLIVGPEGGFSAEEINKALVKGIKISSLGKRILRAETASIVSLSLVSFLLQNYDIIKKNEHNS